MDTSVIVIDSDDEDNQPQTVSVVKKPELKRAAPSDVNENGGSSSKVRRIQPTKIGEIGDASSRDPHLCEAGSSSSVELDEEAIKQKDEKEEHIKTEREEAEAGPSKTKHHKNKNEITPQLEKLIRACRAAESSDEMKQVIKQKLLRYYHSVHPDYVTSKNFRKTLATVAEDIESCPHGVFLKLTPIIEELDQRRKSKDVIVTNEVAVDVNEEAGDEMNKVHIKKLHKALVKVKREIAKLDEEEVDWEDDDNSAYLKKVRFEKRACEIYEKICTLTGESSHAHRIVKKPIKFKGTDFPAFNRNLTKIVNQGNAFPNFVTVLKCLDYCNKKHSLGLVQDQMKRIAQDAFEKLGKTLQERRRRDFYETAQFYVGKNKDPAKEDPELRSQLEKNKKFYARYDEIINEYAEKEHKVHSDAEEVSSTSKNEIPVVETKDEPEDEANLIEEDLITPCDNNGLLPAITLDDSDLMIIS